jgi:hypothetical protein
MDLPFIDRALTNPGFFVNNDPHPCGGNCGAKTRSTGQRAWSEPSGR